MWRCVVEMLLRPASPANTRALTPLLVSVVMKVRRPLCEVATSSPAASYSLRLIYGLRWMLALCPVAPTYRLLRNATCSFSTAVNACLTTGNLSALRGSIVQQTLLNLLVGLGKVARLQASTVIFSIIGINTNLADSIALIQQCFAARWSSLHS